MTERLHPDIARARNLVRAATSDVPRDKLVLVAVSGGADSLALAAATGFVARRAEWDAGAVVVDHGLQPDSAAVARTAAERVRGLGLDTVEVVAAEVDPDSHSGPEGAARTARYDALAATARHSDAAAVLLGHTLDDQAETVLLGLARGSGARSIAGMPTCDGLWRRPFLTFTRTQTRAVCEAAGTQWWEDPHNADSAYARVRVRERALPALEEALGPGVRAALARTADRLRADTDYLDQLAVDAYRQAVDGPALAVDVLADLAPALRSRVIHRHATAMGCPRTDLATVHIAEVERLVTDWHGQARIELPGRVAVVRRSGRLVFGSG